MRRAWLLVAMAACGPKMHAGGGSGSGGDDDATPDATSVGEPDAATCGAQTQDIGVVNLGDPPDLLVVLDRSGSMTDFAGRRFRRCSTRSGT